MDDNFDNISEFLSGRLTMPPVPAHVEIQITTPHDHEDDQHKPVWLIWMLQRIAKDGYPYWPRLDSVCDTDDSARYHVRAAIQSHPDSDIHVERVPFNHRFASSLEQWQQNSHNALWKLRADRNKREGD